MKNDTHGWYPIYDLKDQCGHCTNVVKEHRMAACEYAKPGFPAAHNCPVFAYNYDEDERIP